MVVNCKANSLRFFREIDRLFYFGQMFGSFRKGFISLAKALHKRTLSPKFASRNDSFMVFLKVFVNQR